MISDITIEIDLGQATPIHDGELYKCCACFFNVVRILSVPLTSCSPVSLPLLRPPYFLSHKNIEIKSVNNPAMESKCLSKNSNVSITLNEMLEMIKHRKSC